MPEGFPRFEVFLFEDNQPEYEEQKSDDKGSNSYALKDEEIPQPIAHFAKEVGGLYGLVQHRACLTLVGFPVFKIRDERERKYK